jgi:hypothetical protein
VEARAGLLEAIENETPEKVRPWDLMKLIDFLKQRKAYEIEDIPNECPKHLPRRPLVPLAKLINHCICLRILPNLGRKQK